MAEKILNTRIQLKYDSYANWTSTTLGENKGANFVLKAGEIGICYLPTDYSEKQVVGSQPPQILMKVGNGSSKFSELPWVSAKAADVYEWAKQASLPVTKEGNGNVVAGITWDEATKGIKFTTASVATSEGMEQLANRVTAIENGYATDAELAAAVEAINAAIALKADKTYVDEQLALKVNVSDFNTFKGENTTAIGTAKSEAIAAAKTETETQVNALRDGAVKNNADAIAAIKDHASVDSFADVMTEMTKYQLSGDYATKAEAQGYANAKDEAIAEAKKAGTDAAAALEAYKTSNNAAVALKADQTALDAVSAVANAAATNAALLEEIERAKAAEKANADAIALLTDGVDQEKVDGVKDLIAYVEEHGPEVEQMQKDIAANTKAISDEASRADTEEKRLAGLIGTNAENIQKNADAIAALNAADGKVANASKADVASSLDTAAVEQVKGIKVNNAGNADTLGGKAASEFATAAQGAKADTAVQPAALNNYYTKTQADAEFMNESEVNAKITALDLVNTYDAKGAAATAESNAKSYAKSYADGLAGNYATAAQGAKADSALQEITTTANNGLKVTNKNQIDIDTSVVFVLNCGSSTEVM